MQSFYPLRNTVQPYDWGSTHVIQQLLGLDVDGAPAAELWLGAHPVAPSLTVHDGTATSLVDLVRDDPVATLGQRVQDTYGPRLPYLLKVLAAERGLSLQVHPRPHLARAGFNRENAAGVPLGAPERSFRDDQHKPEMIVALTPFEGLAGFRRPRQALALLAGLDGTLVGRMRDALGRGRSADAVRRAFELAVHARTADDAAPDLDRSLASVGRRAGGGGEAAASGATEGAPGGAAAAVRARADAVALRLGEQYPGDPGVLASYLLNVFTLEPGEAVFLAPGQVHAYVRGAGVEIMASSDNVLRAGLTHKRVDVDALLECSDFVPAPPPRPATSRLARGLTTYRVPIREFGLVVGDVLPVDGELALPGEGPRVVLALGGVLRLRAGAGADTCTVAAGESVFVPDAAGTLSVCGEGRVTVAYVP
ncbi:mannose-6-phosphate isomerase, class I [Luteimicrobium sp. DT211]|uniref:mannose-6-phosphate isomerase, class I n=1 Tax=Luteimicrobium sp. DT211 TaxID=3393412 RepID=UPI003CF7B6D2